MKSRLGARQGTVPWHRHGQALADSFGTSKAALWHEQGRALADFFGTSKAAH
ncbi:hypothetical protein Syun_009471 [Stephania yunnanensis]|uniref:Uncharacterized protein n=1 Tax=Stephania yunnanensis TaxID=152371 RepID=A0AAP0PP26_9MAGN